MLRLKELKITNKEPLHISFYGSIKKGTYNPYNGACEIEPRKDKGEIDGLSFLCPIDEGTFLIYDKKIIFQIMSYFFENCDENLSPQSLWETAKGCKYKSLLKDIEYKDEKYFDNIANCLFKMMKKENNLDKEYIYSIEVAYPEEWKVKYAVEKDIKL